MFRGLLRLTWLETKIFVREPLGVFGSIGVPVLVFVVLARLFGPPAGGGVPRVPRAAEDLPILGSLLIVASALLSLVTIVAIYREGGILRRLRATPLRPQTILSAHVLVKLLSTAVTLALMILAGRRFYPVEGVPLGSYMLALLFTTVTWSRWGSSLRAWYRQRASHSQLAPSSSIRCSVCRGCSCRSSRCRRWRGLYPTSCRSAMPCRCWAASGRARAGWRTRATSRCCC